MATKSHQPELGFSDLELSKPVAEQAGKAKLPGKTKRKTKTALPESKQPFLPGLSRRGRPRSDNPLSATERASRSRMRRTAAGVRRIELLLEPEVVAKLDALIEHYKVPRVEVVSRLIAQAAKRIGTPK